MTPMIGRQAEVAAVVSWVRSESVCLLVEGEAGMGKTTLLADVLTTVRAEGQAVISSAPAEAESRLSYAGLSDLLADSFLRVGPSLPGPQAAALAVAMRLEIPRGVVPDETAVARGLLEAWRCLSSQQGGLLVAIDDVRWLDAPSLAAVMFATRRLRPVDGVRVLLTHRVGAEEARGLTEIASLERLRLAPVSVGAMHRLIRLHTGVSLTRPRLLEAHAASGGNPLLALELVRAMRATGETGPGTLAGLYRRRLARLPAEATLGLVLLAASADRSIERLDRAWGGGYRAAIRPAIAAGLVEDRGEHVGPAHPLITVVAYEDAPPEERRHAHRLLSLTAVTSEERAIHLGRATDGTDAAAAAEIEASAVDAGSRGLRAVAAPLWELAATLTPPLMRDDRGRRLLGAASAWFAAGDADRVELILAPLRATLPPGDLRSEAEWRLGVALDERGRWREATDLWGAALEGALDRGLRARVQCSMAITAVYTQSVEAAHDLAAGAVADAEAAALPERLAEALAVQALTLSLQGSSGAAAVIERALAIEAVTEGPLGEWSPSGIAAECARHSGDIAAAQRHYGRVLERAVSVGDANVEQWAAFGLASADLLAGDYRRASRLADTVLDLADQTGLMRIPARSLRAHVDAHLGRFGRARRFVAEALEDATAAAELTHLFGALNVLGTIEAFAGDIAGACDALEKARHVALEVGLAHATVHRALLHEAELAAAAGRHDQAAAALGAFETLTAGQTPAWSMPVLHRTRGSMLAAVGDLEAAIAELELAVASGGSLPLDRGRALLALGVCLRRQRAYARARATLEQAGALFTALGTPPWVERAGEEIGRIPGRQSSRGSGLTDAEERIASLVAAGHSNKAVAAQLVLSVKTIEVTLTRVYGKLGVRSRAGLAAAYRPGGPATNLRASGPGDSNV